MSPDRSYYAVGDDVSVHKDVLAPGGMGVGSGCTGCRVVSSTQLSCAMNILFRLNYEVPLK